MKVLRPKSIFTLLYGLAMMIPCFAIGITCAYVVCNKNAYQSYSGTNQNTESIIVVDDIETLDYSKTYKLGNSYLNTSVSATSSAYIYFDSVNVIYDLSNKPLANVDRMYIYANSNTMYYNFYAGTTNITYGSSENFLIEVKIRSFNGNETAINNLNTDLSNSSTLYYIEYFNEQQLDNVFYYAVDKFTKDNNFGEIDFFYYFRGMFLSDTSANNQWFNFINWYMNYAMLVSCAYILFLAMMWFINFARKLLEKGFNAYDW